MNLARINELKNIIDGLYGVLKKLKERKSNLEREVANTKNAQERIEYAVATAKNRVSALAALGLRAEFLEDIIYPIQNKPDCSGIGTIVENEISGAEDEIQRTNNKIWSADQEKKQLEMEDVV